jgi:hypothetical protein
MKNLVLIHGRSQQMKDPAALKKSWVDALRQGLSNAGLPTALDELKIHFPYYGDTLINLIDKVDNPAPVVVKGLKGVMPEQMFKAAVFAEAVRASGVTEAQIQAERPAGDAEAAQVTEKGPLNWGWVLAGLRAIDKLRGGSWALEKFTNDVYQYLTDDDIRKAIDDGVRQAFTNEQTVVIAHSLGTIVAYHLMKEEAAAEWNISTLITLGSPLAVGAVSERIRPLIKPSCVKDWFNGRDPHDMVALFPLAPPRFPVTLTGSKDNIANTSDNHHGIESYLADKDVAQWIFKAIQD